MLIWTCPVQAEYIGTLQGSQAWALNVDNGQVTSGSTAVTVHYVVGRFDDIRIGRCRPAEGCANLRNAPDGHQTRHHRGGRA